MTFIVDSRMRSCAEYNLWSTRKRPFRVIVSNVFGVENRGDWVLFDALYRSLTEALDENTHISAVTRWPGHQARFYPRITWLKQFGADRGTKLRRWFSAARGISGVICWRGLATEEERRTEHHFRTAQLVVACPGGYLEDTRTSLFVNCTQLYLATKFGQRLILAPQTIGPLRYAHSRLVVTGILSKASRICLRDRYSTDVLRSSKFTGKLCLIPDMALYYPKYDYEEATRLLRDIGIQPRKFLLCIPIDWYFPDMSQPTQAKQKFENDLRVALNTIGHEFGLAIFAIRQIEPGPEGSGDTRLVQRICRDETNFYAQTDAVLTPSGFRALAALSAGVLSCRFHGALMALQAGARTAMVGYLPKSESFAKEHHIAEFHVRIEQADRRALIELLRKMLTTEAELWNRTKQDLDAQGREGRNEWIRILKCVRREV